MSLILDRYQPVTNVRIIQSQWVCLNARSPRAISSHRIRTVLVPLVIGYLAVIGIYPNLADNLVDARPA